MAIPPIDIRILFTNYDIITYFLNLASCHVHANIDIECLYLSLYHCNALVYENKES